MPEQFIQSSFNSGEWSPKLYARVDMQKYRSGAALLENFFIDYRGGASTRPGTKYILQCRDSTADVRLITFQASATVGYALEFGDEYIRFFYNGEPVLETGTTITAQTPGSPVVFTDAAHGYSDDDWIFAGNKYYIIQNATLNTFTLTDLFGNAVNTNPFSLPTTARRVYTIDSPYAAADLDQVKFAQNVSQMILCHPDYAPYVLTLITATNWTMLPITFGTTVTAPTGFSVSTSLAAGSVYYSYQFTTVDENGQESAPSGVGAGPYTDIRTTSGTITFNWTGVTGATSYNVYKCAVSYGASVPLGQLYGFVGAVTLPSFIDDNIGADFTQTPPVAKNPFSGGNNPSVPGFFQQRLVLAAPTTAPQTFYMSQPGNYFNFDVSSISQATDAITGTLVSGQLNTIRAMVPQPTGLLLFTDRNNWLVNGGSNGSAVSPAAIVANAQSFNGISNVPPIIANFDVLYVQAKGSIVRDSAYNIYANVYTGTDISALSSHLFTGYVITEWAWAEEPFKVVWAVRDDGTMLNLTFLKEQEFIGWTHSVTDGSYKSVCAVVEDTALAGQVDAIYTVVEREVQGQTLKYIERVAERIYPNGAEDAWCVDCGIQYDGVPATSFTGAEFLAGLTVTGLADGVVIPEFTMPADGNFTLSSAASKVTVGLPFTCKLQTLPLDMGEPTVQGKVKKINSVDVRVSETLGLEIGADFDHLTPMKDLIVGNVSSMLVGQESQIVEDLVTGDARTWLAPTFTVPGQYCIQQSQPYPATILGVIPNITIGDDGGRRG